MTRKLLVAAIATLLAVLPIATAQANPSKGPLAAGLVVECSINYDHFPQPIKSTNSNNCLGLATGIITGLQSNGAGGVVVAVAAANSIAISEQHFEPCLEGVLGFSNGVGTVANLAVVDVTKAGNVFQRIGTYQFPYDSTRVGAMVVFTTGKGVLADPKKGSSTHLNWGTAGSASDSIGGLGLGLFVPESVPDTVCPGSPLTVQLAAVFEGL